MKIRNQKYFVTAIIMEIIAIVCLITFLCNQETRYILAFLLTFIYGIISFYNSSNRKGSIEVASRNMDERDNFTCDENLIKPLCEIFKIILLLAWKA